ncbi:MAG: UvrD-helicase domain-containing protein [Betaproteobacteria bacterium]
MTTTARGSLDANKTRWTPEQWEAISTRGRNLLVSAAAGAGKTSVLVERVIGLITDPVRPVDIDRLLVVTFTDAAAAEMRERITAALDGLLSEGAVGAALDPARLAKQLVLVKKADISTIHSFCHKVVRQHFYRLDIDPAFRVMDEVEAALLRLETADDLFEECYGDSEGGVFIDLVEAYGGERGDEALRDLVIRIYERSRGRARPDAWLDEMVYAFRIEPAASVDALPWTQTVVRAVTRDLVRACRLLSQALELAGSRDGPGAYAATLQEDIGACSRLLEAATMSGFAGLYESMSGFAFEKLPRIKGGACNDALKKRAKDMRDAAKRLVSRAREMYFSRPPEDYVADVRKVAPLMHELIRVVREFARRYSEAKRARGLVDFSDLEHFCLRALGTWDEESGRFQPTDIARELAERYEEVLVDEYQDINPVQDAILALVSRGDNTFIVGDVKQSIYGFRLAEPRLFTQRYRSYSAAVSGMARRIDLSKNFRSRRAVIDAVNFVFRQVFSDSVAGIVYDRPAELAYGADYPDESGAGSGAAAGTGARVAGAFPVEVHIIERKPAIAHEGVNEGEDSAEEGAAEIDREEVEEPEAGTESRGREDEPTPEEVEALELEGRLIADRISRMVTGTPEKPGPEFLVWDRKAGAYRPVSYRDIVVLLRSTRQRANVFLEVFRQAGLPAYAELGTGYFEATEVEVMLSLLRVIDNPMQDIPLAAVLRSPICGFSADDLARVRVCRPDGDFYAALETVAAGAGGATNAAPPAGDDGRVPRAGRADLCSEDLRARVQRFLCDIERWRTLARRVPLSTLIWSLYRETGFLDYVGGMPGGVQRQANLRALHERARQFDRFARQGLFRFLRFVERLRDAEGDLGTARALGEAEDVVRIMSVHKSKGLEFPVVFLADLGKEFNLKDLAGDVLFHPEAGLGPVLCDVHRRVKYPTLAHRAVKERARVDALAEEMRILYVGMTRAKERLILVGSAADLGKQAEHWCAGLSRRGWELGDDVLLSARGFLDWVCTALARHRCGAGIRALAGIGGDPLDTAVREDPSRFEVRIWNASDVPRADQAWDDSGRGAEFRAALEGMAFGKPLGRTLAPEFRQAIEAHVGWRYSYAALVGRAAKTTWSEIKRKFEPGRDDAEPRGEGTSEVRRALATFSEQPRFMREFKITPAERGQAIHLVLQHVDLGRRLDAPGVRARVDEMVACDLLTRDLARAVDVEAIARFFASPLGRRVVEARDRVRREVPFYLGMDAQTLYPDISEPAACAGERVVVQGIIDCLIDERDGFVLIDFKTGPLAEGDPRAAAAAYAGQIRVYAAAVEAVYGRPVKEAYLYFLGAGAAVRVDSSHAVATNHTAP